MYQKVPVTLTDSQFMKIRAGHPVQLSSQQIGGGRIHQHHLMLHPENAKKVAGAIRKQKGVRIFVSPHEFEASGEGIMDFFKKVKEGAQWVKNKVIDTPFYQQNLRPIAKNLVNQGIDTFVPVQARAVAHKAADFAGEKTGAFGLKAGKKRKRKHKKSVQSVPMVSDVRQQNNIVPADHAAIRHYAFTPVWDAGYHPQYRLDSNYSPMMGPQSPAMWPTMPHLPDIGGAVKGRRGPRGFGGSFRPA